MTRLRRCRARLSLLFAWLALSMVGPAAAREAFAAAAAPRMAMIMPGTIQDSDFNTLGYVALQEVGKRYGLPVSHSEQISVADAERVAREYLASGYTIVAFHGAQYLTVLQKLSRQFREASFIIVSQGRGLPGNVWNIRRLFHEGFYPVGALAGMVTRTNRVGYVSGIRLPEFIASLNASYEGMKAYNPKASLVYTFTGDQNDPVRGRQAAASLIASGADVLISALNLGVFGVIEAASASPRPVLLTSFYTDKSSMAPKVILTSLVLDFGRPYVEIVGSILEGKRSGDYDMRPGRGMELAPILNAPPEVAERVRGIFREVEQGKPIPEVLDRIVVP